MLRHPEDEEMPFVRMKFGNRGLVLVIGFDQLLRRRQLRWPLNLETMSEQAHLEPTLVGLPPISGVRAVNKRSTSTPRIISCQEQMYDRRTTHACSVSY